MPSRRQQVAELTSHTKHWTDASWCRTRKLPDQPTSCRPSSFLFFFCTKLGREELQQQVNACFRFSSAARHSFTISANEVDHDALARSSGTLTSCWQGHVMQWGSHLAPAATPPAGSKRPNSSSTHSDRAKKIQGEVESYSSQIKKKRPQEDD